MHQAYAVRLVWMPVGGFYDCVGGRWLVMCCVCGAAAGSLCYLFNALSMLSRLRRCVFFHGAVRCSNDGGCRLYLHACRCMHVPLLISSESF
jgi:hypothetical protein